MITLVPAETGVMIGIVETIHPRIRRSDGIVEVLGVVWIDNPVRRAM